VAALALPIGVIQSNLDEADEAHQTCAGDEDPLISLALGRSNCFLFFGQLAASASSRNRLHAGEVDYGHDQGGQ